MPDGRLWLFSWRATAGKDCAEIYCLGIGDGIERRIEVLEDIPDFLDDVPMTGLGLTMCHKVFDIQFAGFDEYA